jgi:serine/threonine protein kinase
MIGKKIQNYKIISLLGEGGMGAVYKAFDVKLERFVALKILNLNSTSFLRIIERFRKEARNHAKLNHPNIVSVYGFVEEKDIMGIAMEYVEGQTLEQIIQIEGKLKLHHAFDIISQALEGVTYAHEQGFIHRDLKPSNIIIDFNGNIKIMDFGISKSIDEIETITQHNSRPGTLLYMSPEQLSGNEVTIKSDLYSLGITLYEMMAGYYPFDSKTFYEIVDSHVNKIPAKISDTFPDVPEEADEIILKAMGKSSGNNFNSAWEFNDAIKNLLDQNKFDNIEERINPVEQTNSVSDRSKKKIFANKFINFFLFIIFIVLSIYVYSVVKETIRQKELKDRINSLNYTQDYSKNPNYLERTNWESVILNTDINLNSVYFLDNLNGIIVGSEGIIMKTTDSGQNWERIDVNSKVEFHSIYGVSGRIYCVGDHGVLLKFESNLKKWEKITISSKETLFDIKFINDNIGFIVGTNGLILKTFDGGLTWQKLKNIGKENLFSIDFADEKNGFAIGWDDAILKTEDQGLNWSYIKFKYKSYLKNILFVNQFLGFIVGGNGLLLRTEDGGSTWKKIDIETDSGLYKIFFENNEEGIIISNRGEILRTKDAGKTWTKDNVGKSVILNDIQKLSSGRYIIVGNNGSLFFSKIKEN